MYPQVSTNIKGDRSSSCQNKRPYPRHQSIDDIDIYISPRGTLDDKVQFRLIPRLPSVLPIHGRYGHTGTIHSVDTNLWLWVSVIRSKIHHRRGYQSNMGVFGDPPGPYAALLIQINLISALCVTWLIPKIWHDVLACVKRVHILLPAQSFGLGCGWYALL